jgi:hypothetical protein
MTSVKTFWPTNRLKKLVAAPGGMNLDDAVARAEQRLETISESCLAGIDAKIEELSVLSSTRGSDGGVGPTVDRIYQLSNEIFAEGGAFGRAALSTAAHSLCDLTGPGNESDGSVWEAIDVHVQSMRVLRRSDVETSDQMCRAVLDGLRAVSRRSQDRGVGQG